MDSKKKIMSFIRPNLVLPIILLIPPLTVFGLIILLFSTIPTYVRASKHISKLESSGELDQAAEELTSANAKRYMNGKVVLTDNYVFCKRNGFVFTYDEILWVYKHRYTKRFLFIPISVTDSLYLASKDMKPHQVAAMGKDKMDDIKNAIVEIYRHNNKCLIGYTNENAAKYKQLTASK